MKKKFINHYYHKDQATFIIVTSYRQCLNQRFETCCLNITAIPSIPLLYSAHNKKISKRYVYHILYSLGVNGANVQDIFHWQKVGM